MKRSPRRVLIVQPYGIGDLLFLTPVFRALRLIPSVEKVDLLLGSRTEAVVRSNPHIDKTFVLDKGKMHTQSRFQNLRETADLWKQLKAERYDLLLDYSMRGEMGFYGRFFMGISKTAGYDYKNRGFFHSLKSPLPEGFAGKPVVDFAADLAEAAGVQVRDRFLEFYFSTDEVKALSEKFSEPFPERSVVVSLGGGESWGKDAHLKQWPSKRYAELLTKLLAPFKILNVDLVGSEKEKNLAREFQEAFEGDAVDYTGALSLTETAWVMQNAALFVGNDGGLLHLASALRKPIVGFYGPADPAVYGPYDASKAVILSPPGGPTYRRFRYESGDKSILSISVSEAYEKIMDAREKLGV